MTDDMKKARVALVAAADPSNSANARMSAIGSPMRYNGPIPWQSRAGFLEGLQAFLKSVADDRKGAYGVRQRANYYLSKRAPHLICGRRELACLSFWVPPCAYPAVQFSSIVSYYWRRASWKAARSSKAPSKFVRMLAPLLSSRGSKLALSKFA